MAAAAGETAVGVAAALCDVGEVLDDGRREVSRLRAVEQFQVVGEAAPLSDLCDGLPAGGLDLVAVLPVVAPDVDRERDLATDLVDGTVDDINSGSQKI